MISSGYADDLRLGASILFDSTTEQDNYMYQNLFNYHFEGVGVLVSRCSLLKMRIEKGAVVRTMFKIEDPVQSII